MLVLAVIGVVSVVLISLTAVWVWWSIATDSTFTASVANTIARNPKEKALHAELKQIENYIKLSAKDGNFSCLYSTFYHDRREIADALRGKGFSVDTVDNTKLLKISWEKPWTT
ncbi:MAG: hypothetical protein WC965_02190 [Thiohalomonadaceae bacterium]